MNPVSCGRWERESYIQSNDIVEQTYFGVANRLLSLRSIPPHCRRSAQRLTFLRQGSQRPTQNAKRPPSTSCHPRVSTSSGATLRSTRRHSPQKCAPVHSLSNGSSGKSRTARWRRRRSDCMPTCWQPLLSYHHRLAKRTQRQLQHHPHKTRHTHPIAQQMQHRLIIRLVIAKLNKSIFCLIVKELFV